MNNLNAIVQCPVQVLYGLKSVDADMLGMVYSVPENSHR